MILPIRGFLKEPVNLDLGFGTTIGQSVSRIRFSTDEILFQSRHLMRECNRTRSRQHRLLEGSCTEVTG